MSNHLTRTFSFCSVVVFALQYIGSIQVIESLRSLSMDEKTQVRRHFLYVVVCSMSDVMRVIIGGECDLVVHVNHARVSNKTVDRFSY